MKSKKKKMKSRVKEFFLDSKGTMVATTAELW